jgi:hypothetical protein
MKESSSSNPLRVNGNGGLFAQLGSIRVWMSIESRNRLALQLQFSVDMGLSCNCLVCSSPKRPCDDVSGLDASLREADGDTADFLNRPPDQRRRGLVF